MDLEELQLRAPRGKFRVIGFALRDGQKYMIGDFDSREAAEEYAKRHGMVGNPAHVYNDRSALWKSAMSPDYDNYPKNEWPHAEVQASFAARHECHRGVACQQV